MHDKINDPATTTPELIAIMHDSYNNMRQTMENFAQKSIQQLLYVVQDMENDIQTLTSEKNNYKEQQNSWDRNTSTLHYALKYTLLEALLIGGFSIWNQFRNQLPRHIMALTSSALAIAIVGLYAFKCYTQAQSHIIAQHMAHLAPQIASLTTEKTSVSDKLKQFKETLQKPYYFCGEDIQLVPDKVVSNKNAFFS